MEKSNVEKEEKQIRSSCEVIEADQLDPHPLKCDQEWQSIGTFGEVLSSILTRKDSQSKMKVLLQRWCRPPHLDSDDEEDQRWVQNENCNILASDLVKKIRVKQFDNEYLAKVIGISVDPYFLYVVIQDPEGISIQEAKIPENKKIDVMYQIAQGMDYLHSLKMVHHYLMPRNILVDKLHHVYISDYVLYTFLPVKIQRYLEDLTSRSRNMYAWIAPELFIAAESGELTQKQACDVYSFGMICWTLFSEKVPFQKMRPYEIIKEVTKQGRPSLDEIHSEHLKNILRDCWARNPGDRPLFKEIVKKIEHFAIK